MIEESEKRAEVVIYTLNFNTKFFVCIKVSFDERFYFFFIDIQNYIFLNPFSSCCIEF